jgi:D-alanyl-D-alanine carboxypeptidase
VLALTLVSSAVVMAAAPAEATTKPQLHAGLARLVAQDGFPGAEAVVRDPDGHWTSTTAGVGDVATGARVPANGRVRLGSNSKVFVATVMLQLVAQGKVRLDAPVETYLPGVVRGPDYSGKHITVRELLQHTSGLPDYVPVVLGPKFADVQHRYFDPYELLSAAFGQKALFKAGTSWEYSNTNYVLAGLIVQRVTGRPLGEEIQRRILTPLHLKDTTFPAPGSQAIPGQHPHGYDADKAGQPLRDVTVMDPSWGWSAGSMIGTPRDLDTFLLALLHGKLLPKAELAMMQHTVSTHGRLWPGARYGLGLISTPLSCGGLAWGHGGDIEGYETRDAVGPSGRAATLAVTALPAALPSSMPAAFDVIAGLDTALCAS